MNSELNLSAFSPIIPSLPDENALSLVSSTSTLSGIAYNKFENLSDQQQSSPLRERNFVEEVIDEEAFDSGVGAGVTEIVKREGEDAYTKPEVMGKGQLLDSGKFLRELNGFQERCFELADKRYQKVITLSEVKLNQKWPKEQGLKEHEELVESKKIYQLIRILREKLNQIVVNWESKIQVFMDHPFNQQTAKLYELLSGIKTIFIDKNDLKGQGGIYKGKSGQSFIGIKVKGEGVCELNNNRCRASVLPYIKVKKSISSYEDNEREAATYEYACRIDLGEITPAVVLAIMTNEENLVKVLDNGAVESERGFSDISDRLFGEELESVKNAGSVNPKKVCSIQEWKDDARGLVEKFEIWAKEASKEFRKNYPEEIIQANAQLYKVKELQYVQDEFAKKIDFEDYEKCNILQWTAGETDGNVGNYLLFLKDLINGKYGIIKIDNALCFPESNEEFTNALISFTSLSSLPISQKAKEIIFKIKKEDYQVPLERYQLDKSIKVTEERLELIKEILNEFPEITHREMDYRLSLFAKGGRDEAMKKINQKDLGIVPSKRKEVHVASSKATDIEERIQQKTLVENVKGNVCNKSSSKLNLKGLIRRVQSLFFSLFSLIITSTYIPAMSHFRRVFKRSDDIFDNYKRINFVL